MIQFNTANGNSYTSSKLYSFYTNSPALKNLNRIDLEAALTKTDLKYNWVNEEPNDLAPNHAELIAKNITDIVANSNPDTLVEQMLKAPLDQDFKQLINFLGELVRWLPRINENLSESCEKLFNYLNTVTSKLLEQSYKSAPIFANMLKLIPDLCVRHAPELSRKLDEQLLQTA